MFRGTNSAPSSGTRFHCQPPMYWKVPGSERPERDYIVENMKHVRQVSTEVKKTKSKTKLEPMKVKFIPGLTKNPNYDHVESRISGLIKGTTKFGPRDSLTNSNSATSLNKGADDTKPIWGGSAAANARRIKSTSDLKKLANSNTPVLRRRPNVLKPQQESVYNWHFKDADNISPGFSEQERLSNPERFPQFKDSSDLHFHRVEYLPCDGICADELAVGGTSENGSGDGGSGRSSRGINTEETRIFSNNFNNGGLRASQSLSRLNEDDVGDSLQNLHLHPSRFPQQTENLQQQKQSQYESHGYQAPSHPQHAQGRGTVRNGHRDTMNGGGGDPFVERIKQNMSTMQLNGAPSLRQRYDTDSQTDYVNHNSGQGSAQTPHRGSSGYSVTSPHRAGEVPKYLKKRQQQWKEKEIARKEAEKAATIPAGHVVMSEAERQENLAKLQSTYDNLVNELNRVPIRIDTIRVREYKQHLEQELIKLEQAMKLFSRPTLYIKLDQQQ